MPVRESLADARILALDDEVLNLQVIAALLKLSGFNCVETENDPRMALKRIEQFKPELLLLDLNMPHRSGFEVLADLCGADTSETTFPILVLTADTTTNARHKALGLGASDFLTKPVDRIELELRASNLLATFRLREELKQQTEHLEATVAERTAELSATNLRLLEFDRLKSEFVATASHELRTPLTVIREFTSLLHDGAAGSTEEEITDAYDTILRNCDRLGGLLDDLLDFHRIQTGCLRLHRSRLDLPKLLRQCVHDFHPKCQKSDISLSLSLGVNVGFVLADPDAIVQVLANLLGNAAKFTPKGGAIRLGAYRKRGSVEVYVEDTGAGIACEDIARAFEPFGQIDRTDEGAGVRGTGLGLPISKRIVEKHSGVLKVRSEVGRGSRFYFTLPVWDEEQELIASIKDAADSIKEGAALTLLLIQPIATNLVQTGAALGELLELCHRRGRANDSFALSLAHGAVVCVLTTDAQGADVFLKRLLMEPLPDKLVGIPIRHSNTSIDQIVDPAEALDRALRMLERVGSRVTQKPARITSARTALQAEKAR